MRTLSCHLGIVGMEFSPAFVQYDLGIVGQEEEVQAGHSEATVHLYWYMAQSHVVYKVSNDHATKVYKRNVALKATRLSDL